MRRAPWTTLPLIVLLALPASAGARPLDLLRAAKLQSARGTLTIAETRCPPGSGNCGNVELKEAFKAGPKPRTRPAHGRRGFAAGLRIRGTGTGQCSAESPTSVVTAADGSTQIIGSASRLSPGKFAATRVVAAGARRSIRLGWLEPIDPGISCDYFGERGTRLAVPIGQALQSSLISPRIPARVLKRRSFSVTIAGSQDWNQQESDGTHVSGRASWRLRLSYRR